MREILKMELNQRILDHRYEVIRLNMRQWLVWDLTLPVPKPRYYGTAKAALKCVRLITGE